MKTTKTVKAILACDSKFGIGKDGSLPWPKNSNDLREFRDLTTGQIVIMGSKTWNDPVFPKPLPNRVNYVLSRNPEFYDSRAHIINQNHLESIECIIEEAKLNSQEVWIIGGSQIVEMLYSYIEEFHLTIFDEDYDCDIFIKNPLNTGFVEKSYEIRSDSTKYIFVK